MEGLLLFFFTRGGVCRGLQEFFFGAVANGDNYLQR
jgi:hypothetical protein